MSLTWRPLTFADAEPLARVLAAAAAVEPVDDHYSAADLREDWSGPGVDLDAAATAAWDGDRLVGYGLVRRSDAANPAHLVRIEGLVHPDHRTDAVGRDLTEWFLETGKAVHARSFPGAPLELHFQAHENQRWMTSALASAGYRHERSFVAMRTGSLAELPPPGPLPEQLPLVPYAERYAELTRLARNEIFASNWGNADQSPEAWAHEVTQSRTLRADLSFLLLSTDRAEVVAFVLCAFFAADAEVTGVKELYVFYVGTRAPLRGKGLATALLGYTLARASEAGFDRSATGVDVDNANRALGIYERCGYRATDNWAGYVLRVA